MISVKQLSKKYNDITVLEDINLNIADGDIYGLAGVSGVGKSTLLNCLNGIETYESGSIQIDGIQVECLKKKELREFRRTIGMIFQDFSLISRKTVYKNIAFPMECWGYSKSEIDDRVKQLASLVGIEDQLYKRPAKLSVGQKQRVAIARGLTLEPKYILCDECTSALDPRSTNSILDLLMSLHEQLGLTIIVVTHEMSVIKRICNQMAIMEEGRIAVSGSVSEVFTKQPEALLNLTGEERRRESEQGKGLIELDEVQLEQVMTYLKESGIASRRVEKGDILC